MPKILYACNYCAMTFSGEDEATRCEESHFSICAKCGNRFIKNMKSKIYCSDRCRAAAKEKRIRERAKKNTTVK